MIKVILVNKVSKVSKVLKVIEELREQMELLNSYLLQNSMDIIHHHPLLKIQENLNWVQEQVQVIIFHI